MSEGEFYRDVVVHMEPDGVEWRAESSREPGPVRILRLFRDSVLVAYYVQTEPSEEQS